MAAAAGGTAERLSGTGMFGEELNDYPAWIDPADATYYAARAWRVAGSTVPLGAAGRHRLG